MRVCVLVKEAKEICHQDRIKLLSLHTSMGTGRKVK